MALRNRASVGIVAAAAAPILLSGAGLAAPGNVRALASSSESASASSPSSAAASAPAASSAGVVGASPEQVVWLRSGGVIRGQIVEYDPGHKVVLQLATGEIRTVAWSEVARASWIAEQAAGTVSSPALTAAAPPRRPDLLPTTGKVMVHILPADGSLWLEDRPRYDASAAWQRSCQAPCDRYVEVEERSLRIGGPLLHPSNAFHVKGDGSVVKLVVRPGLESTHGWGRGLLISGISVELASSLLYGLGRLEDKDGMVIGGIIGMAVGAGMIVGSLPLLGAARTTVRNAEGERVGQALRWPTF